MKKGCIFGRIFKKLLGILAATVGVLFTIYFLNLDMKLVGWLYDRKPRDVQF